MNTIVIHIIAVAVSICMLERRSVLNGMSVPLSSEWMFS